MCWPDSIRISVTNKGDERRHFHKMFSKWFEQIIRRKCKGVKTMHADKWNKLSVFYSIQTTKFDNLKKMKCFKQSDAYTNIITVTNGYLTFIKCKMRIFLSILGELTQQIMQHSIFRIDIKPAKISSAAYNQQEGETTM